MSLFKIVYTLYFFERTSGHIKFSGKIDTNKFIKPDTRLNSGMHAYLTDFLERINDLGARISQDFLVG